MSMYIQQEAFRQKVIAPRDVVANELLEVSPGGPVGFCDAPALQGEPVTVHLNGRVEGTSLSPSGVSQTFGGEVWSLGDAMYYHRVQNLVGIGATDQPIGHAMADKATDDPNGCVFMSYCCKDAGSVLMTLDFSQVENQALTMPGDIVIATGPMTIVSGSLRNSSLGSNSGGDAATVALGDSAGTGVELLAATVVGVLPAVSALNTNIAITENLILRVGIEALDAGAIIIEAVRSPF